MIHISIYWIYWKLGILYEEKKHRRNWEKNLEKFRNMKGNKMSSINNSLIGASDEIGIMRL